MESSDNSSVNSASAAPESNSQSQSAPSGDASDPKPLWGRLVSLSDKHPNVELRDDSITLGRSAACQVVIESPAISSKHCLIYREKSEVPTKGGAQFKTENIVFIKDTSTNGTYVKGDLVGRDKTRPLFDGCDISLLPKKTADRIAYIFQDCQKEMQEIEQGGPQAVYEMKRELGTGTFASVKLAVHRTTGEEVAIKVIDKQKFLQKASRKDALMDEVRVLTSVSHPNILHIRGVFETPTTLYLVLELATGGELFDRVVEGAQPEPVAREMFYQMLLAMKYLHAQGIAHRDLKPENILLQSPSSNVIKISDFGLSRIIDEGTYMKTICGTPQYVAPEILTKAEKEGYGKAVDMWSLGVILFILLGGYAPFEDDADKKVTMFEKIKKAKYSFNPKYWKGVSEEAQDLIRNLLVVDPAKRLTAEQSLSHPWITDHLSELAPQSTAEDPDTKPEPTPVIPKNDTPKNDTPKNDTSKNDKTSSNISNNANNTSTPKSEPSSTTPSKPTTEPETRTTPLSARRKRKAAASTATDTDDAQEANGAAKKKKVDKKDNEDKQDSKEASENGEKEDTTEDKEAKTKKAAPQKKGRGRPKSK